MIQSPQI